MNNKAHLRPQDYDSNGDIIPMSMKEEKGDLISREALKKTFENACIYGLPMNKLYGAILKIIDNAMPANPCENCDLYFKAMTKEEMRHETNN